MNTMNAQTSWVSPKIEIRESPITGRGTFAKEPIQKDEIIIVQGGRILSGSDFDNPEFEPVWYHAFQVEKDMYICPPQMDRATFDGIFNVNHSCDPTCGFKGQITMVSMRNIEAGEEITFDYAMSDVGVTQEEWQPMNCLCKAPTCRNQITGDDWKLPHLQKKYKGYFSSYVNNLISSQ